MQRRKICHPDLYSNVRKPDNFILRKGKRIRNNSHRYYYCLEDSLCLSIKTRIQAGNSMVGKGVDVLVCGAHNQIVGVTDGSQAQVGRSRKLAHNRYNQCAAPRLYGYEI
jgi:hypothetical protein